MAHIALPESKKIDLVFVLLYWSANRRLPIGADLSCGADQQVLRYLTTRSLDSLYYLASGTCPAAQRTYDLVWKAQCSALIEIVAELARRGISPILVKGAELVRRFFADSALGLMHDVDLLVRRKELQEVKAALFKLGFRQAYFSSETNGLEPLDLADLCEIESTHYELAPFARLEPLALDDEELEWAVESGRQPIWLIEGRPHIVIEVDVHHQLASDIPSGGFFDRAVAGSFERALTLSPGDHVWFTVSRFYNEVALHGKKSMRDLAYIAPLLASEPDWNHVLSAASEFQLQVTLYYFLFFLNEVAGGHVPSSVLEELRPGRNLRSRDWGWQLGKLFDFDESFPTL